MIAASRLHPVGAWLHATLCRGNADRYGGLLNHSVYCWRVMVTPPLVRRKCRRTHRVTRNGKIDRRTLLRLLAGTVGVAAMAVAPEGFAQQRPTPPPKPPPKLPPKLRLVVLDPGHGGVDPGAIGRTGTYEKDVAL